MKVSYGQSNLTLTGLIKTGLAITVFSAMSLANADKVSYSTSSDSASDRIAVAPSTGIARRSPGKQITVKIINSCFATNLRGVSNPIAPNSIITTQLGLTVGKAPIRLKVSYPGTLTTASGAVADSSMVNLNPKDALLSGPSPHVPAPAFFVTDAKGQAMTNVTAGVYGNTVQLRFDAPPDSIIKTSDGISEKVASAIIEKPSFYQYVLSCDTWGTNRWGSQMKGCGVYMGKTGPLTAALGGTSVSSDNTNIELRVSFPGQTGFCGGYFSPLMVFFDEERPKFSGVSHFLKGKQMATSWPEAGAPGYFLAIDRKGGKKIASADQLFGDSTEDSNGFVALTALDSNKDGVISAADKDFAKLLLWQDRNGDGVAQAGEVLRIADKKITELSLNYVKENRLLGETAQEYGVSEFSYKKGKETVKAKLVDVWMKPMTDAPSKQ